VGGVSIQSVFAQQENSTVSEDTVSEDTVDDRNALPVADDKHIETNQNEPIDIQLTGSDTKRKEQTELAKKLH
jgi:hypothetical protein